MPASNSSRHPKDLIFKRRTPLLFAHRGGAGEAPESTEEAFRYAVEQGADVLELDVRLTRDGKIVVWHGPKLKNVCRRSGKPIRRGPIGDFYWHELRDKAWVVHPTNRPEFAAIPERRLMLLSDFFVLVDKIQRTMKSKRTLHLNIEIKAQTGKAPNWKNEHFKKLLDMVDEQSKRRTIILASMNIFRLRKLRKCMKKRSTRHPTNLAISELLVWKHLKWCLVNVAYETSHKFANRNLVKKVHKAGGSFYVFLTGIPLLAPAIDGKDTKELKELKELKERLFELLNMGVDGIMTDYPKKVGTLIRKWKRQRNAR